MGTKRGWWWGTAVFLSLFILASLTMAQDTPDPSPLSVTPTVDRLAAPPTVPAPTQADEGAQLYWLYCQPCHGDQGQGLTDEWREQFPEEEQYCWQSGCHSEHGKNKPEHGFILPTVVPALIGEDSLKNFETVQQLYFYIRQAMPYEMPGRLTDEEYWAITAHLLQARNLWDGTPLNETNTARLRFNPLTEEGTDQQERAGIDNREAAKTPQSTLPPAIIWGSGLVIIFLAGGVWFWRGRRR